MISGRCLKERRRYNKSLGRIEQCNIEKLPQK
jgi:hypothetical protein